MFPFFTKILNDVTSQEQLDRMENFVNTYPIVILAIVNQNYDYVNKWVTKAVIDEIITSDDEIFLNNEINNWRGIYS